ncbi:MAG: flagellin [Porticoccaceae bacterium]|nr:flagellin [Porticoccaceae bacterium]
MAVINTNVAATLTANALSRNERAATQAMERLSTGLKINSAADDAAGMAMANTMTAQIKGLNMAVKNANDAIAMIQTADGAAIEIGDMLQRMRELAVQAANGTLDGSTDQDQLDLEYQQLITEIGRVGDNTQWNGSNLIDDSAGSSGTVTYQIGADASQTMTVDFGDLSDDGDLGLTGDIQDITNATAAIQDVDVAITALNTQRATYGAAINRLEHTVDNLSNVSMNTQSAISRIQDADYAAESTALAKTQIIAQAGTAMLAQANQQAQTVLALLK